jgi:hypothetical protein
LKPLPQSPLLWCVVGAELLIGLCPFHKDTNPSLTSIRCKTCCNFKGACGEGGDVILWVLRAEGVSFNHAVEMLKRDYFPSVLGGTKSTGLKRADPPRSAPWPEINLVEIW